MQCGAAVLLCNCAASIESVSRVSILLGSVSARYVMHAEMTGFKYSASPSGPAEKSILLILILDFLIEYSAQFSDFWIVRLEI